MKPAVLALILFFAAVWVLTPTDLTPCLERHSFDSCHSAVNP